MRIVLLAIGALLLASPAAGDCCRLVKLDDGTSAVTVRACEPGSPGACEAMLFEQTLAVGGSREVCVSGDTLMYQEYDPALADFGAPVEALCQGGDVEL